jgi:hypothetical protein
MNWIFTFPREQPKDVTLFFPIQFIIGDCKGHDKLCGHFSSHNNTPGLVRDCDVPTNQGDNPYHQCHFYVKHEMEEYSQQELKARSFHHLLHPCHINLDYSASTQGVFGACLPEKTHCVNMGTTKEVGDQYSVGLSAAGQKHTDDLLSYMIIHTRFPPSLQFPVVSPYRGGIEKVRKLKASERIGKIIALYCVLMSSYSVEFLYHHPKAGEEKKQHLWI